jgi:hypothetical protein
MNRAAGATAAVLIALGAAVFLWKVLLLDMPLLPSNPGNLWQVELQIDARGSKGRGSIRLALPSSGPGQVVVDEHVVSDRLVFSIRTRGEQRIGLWRGPLDGVHELTHSFRVQLSEVRPRIPRDPGEPPPPELARAYRSSSGEFPVDAPEVAELLDRLVLPGADDPLGRARTVFAFAADEVETVETGSDDALLALVAREGSRTGKARLLVTLLRAVGLPARLVGGLRLHPDGAAREAVWAELWVGGGWLTLLPSEGLFGRRPANLLALHVDGAELIRATGVDALGHRYRVLREQLRPEELAAFMVPPSPVLSAISLYRLPVRAQASLRLLLLLPIGALLVAFFRNVIGTPTFGTFMPILLTLAMRDTGLLLGLALAGTVLGVGIASRLLLERLRLLFVPRLCVLLCLVVLGLAAFSLVGRAVENQDLFGALLFPIVILTMLIERFSVTSAEDGLREALVRMAFTTVVAVSAYPIFRWSFAEHLMFGYPELIVCIIGVLILMGGYTGFRVSDLIRFRALASLPREGIA